MTSLIETLKSRTRIGDRRSRIGLAVGLLALLGAMSLLIGEYVFLIPLAVVAAALLLRYPFPFFLGLVATWPVLTLYIVVSLPRGLPDLRYERLLIAAIATGAVVGLLGSRREFPRVSPWVIVFVVAQLVVFARYGFSPGRASDPNWSILISSTLVPLGSYWLTKALINSSRQFELLIFSLVAAALIVALTGFYEQAIQAVESPFPVTTGTASGGRYGGVPGGRAAGVLGNPAIYGAFLGMGAVGAMAMSRISTQVWLKRGLALVASVLVFGVVVSYTRSAWLAAVGSALIAVALISDFRRAFRIAVGVGLALGLTVVATYGSLSEYPVVKNRILESENVVGRTDRVLASIEMAGEQPLTGSGPGALDARIGEVFPGSGFDTSHNTFLTVAVDYGIPTLIVFLVLIAIWLGGAFRVARWAPRGTHTRYLVGPFAAAVIAYVVSGMFLELRFFGYFTAVFWIAGAAIERMNELSVAGSHSNNLIDRPHAGSR